MISVTIRESDLVGACKPALKLFRSVVRMQWGHDAGVLIVREWTPLHDVWLAMAPNRAAEWLRARRIVPEPNLRDADLRDADLRCADLSFADLSGANLSGADLSCADLRCADLNYADLSGANLSGANLSGANLRDADLSGANLRGANLSFANLSGARRSAFDPQIHGWRCENGVLVKA